MEEVSGTLQLCVYLQEEKRRVMRTYPVYLRRLAVFSYWETHSCFFFFYQLCTATDQEITLQFSLSTHSSSETIKGIRDD